MLISAPSTGDGILTVNATGVPAGASVPTSTATTTTSDWPISGARAVLRIGTWCNTTSTRGTTKDPMSGIPSSASVNGVCSATSTLKFSEVPFCTDEKSGRKLKLPVVPSRRSFPPPLGSFTSVYVKPVGAFGSSHVMTPLTISTTGAYVIESAGARSDWDVSESTPIWRRAAPKSIQDSGVPGVGVFGEFPANGLNTSPSTVAKRLGAWTVVEAVVAGVAFIVSSGLCPVRKRGGVHSDVSVVTVDVVSPARPAAARGDASHSLTVDALLTNAFATTLPVSEALSVSAVPAADVRLVARPVGDDDPPEGVVPGDVALTPSVAAVAS